VRSVRGLLTVVVLSVASLAGTGSRRAGEGSRTDSEGLAAWQQVYSVLHIPAAATATPQPIIRNNATTGIGTSSTWCVGRRATVLKMSSPDSNYELTFQGHRRAEQVRRTLRGALVRRSTSSTHSTEPAAP